TKVWERNMLVNTPILEAYGKKHASQYANFGSLPISFSTNNIFRKKSLYFLTMEPPARTDYTDQRLP
ncbi:MAG: hypothetical protein ACLUMH_26265, partial [Bacteroides ovatus]